MKGMLHTLYATSSESESNIMPGRIQRRQLVLSKSLSHLCTLNYLLRRCHGSILQKTKC